MVTLDATKMADWEIAEEFQLDFFTTIFQWKEPKRGAYFWKEVKGDDPFKKHLQSLKQHDYVVSLTNTTVHMDHKHLPKYLEGKPFDDPELLGQGFDWVFAERPELLGGVCAGFFTGGPTPSEFALSYGSVA